MRIKDKVRHSDPVAYSVIRNSKKFNKFSHAYLISADKKEDTKDVVALLFQAIVCEQQNILACDECYSCKRILKGIYVDLQILDGSKGLIKKEMVLNATKALAQTPFETAGKRILYIKNIESTNKQSINSLLKFIEEPTKDTFIIASTNSIGDVLPTIRSRTQLIKVKPKQIKNLSIKLIEQRVSPKYAMILASVFHSLSEALKSYEDNFIDVYNLVGKFVSNIPLNKNIASINFINDFSKNTNSKLYLSILEQFFNDIWRFNVGQEIMCSKFERTIANLSEIKFDFISAIESIWEFKYAIQYNGNFDLSKEKLLIGMVG